VSSRRRGSNLKILHRNNGLESRIPLEAPSADAPGFEIDFKVADVDATFNELIGHGAAPVVEPADRF
jgi:hypothetical protein